MSEFIKRQALQVLGWRVARGARERFKIKSFKVFPESRSKIHRKKHWEAMSFMEWEQILEKKLNEYTSKKLDLDCSIHPGH